MDLLCHVSIPKNASSSIEAFLADSFTGEYRAYRLPGRSLESMRPRCCDSPLEAVQATLFAIRASEQRLCAVSLNLPVGLHRFVRKNVRYLVAIRDPIDRCLSAWHFAAATWPQNPIWGGFEQLNFDLEQILREPWSYELRNDQTRYLAGTCADQIGPAEYKCALDVVCDKKNLIGTVDRLAGLLYEVRPETPQARAARLNATPRHSEQAPRDAALLLATANRWDIELYQAVRELPH